MNTQSSSILPESGVIKPYDDINIWDFYNPTYKKNKWAIFLDNGDFFEKYPTLKAAYADAKKYNISIAQRGLTV